MKAIVSKQSLKDHRTFLSATKPKSAKLAATSEIILTVSEKLGITGFGLHYDIPCESLRWGTAVLPFKTWSALMSIASRPLLGKTITIEAQNGYILFDQIKMKHPDIKVTASNKLVYELPIDADKSQIRSFILESHTVEQIRHSGLWGTYQAIVKEISSNIVKAHKHLHMYGVSLCDIERVLIKALKVKDPDLFIMHLREEYQKRKPKY